MKNGNIKIAIVDAATEVIQTQGKTPRSEWWEEECREIKKKKKQSKKKMVATEH
jgi:hypothetical protein